jgi:CheY-like chemotaxis protein
VPHTLLLADDSVTIQRVIELTFADEDVRVLAVSDGDQAIAAIDKTPPDIVLADVGMPGRDGYQVAEHIKRTPRLAHIPVVLLTGAFEPIDKARAAAVGCDGVLAKPFEPQLVIGRVKELLARPKNASSSDVQPSDLPLTLSPGAAAPADQPAAHDYFDRLDQAFANLSAGASGKNPPSAPAQHVPEAIDWFSAAPPPPTPSAVPGAWDLPGPAAAPQSQAPRQPAAELPPALAPTSAPAPLATPAPAAAAPPQLPALADAFAALLAAEQASPAMADAPAWPTAISAAVITEDVIAEVTRRVLEQLSDRVVRETTAEIVTKVAERLVSEEIERIKAKLK